MKAVNLYVLTRKVNQNDLDEYEYALSGRDSSIKFRPEEIEIIRIMVDNFIFHKASSHIYDGWFYAFSIPQIGKEFDLLRIGENETVNIELKSHEVDLEKIEKQLIQNRYYLSHLNKTISSFAVIKNENDTISVFKYEDELKKSSFDELIKKVGRENKYLEKGIEELFDPCSFLVSPINTPLKFITGQYFLNNQQLAIKKNIMNPNEDQYLFGIKGAAGTGKTLLLYDIAFSFGKARKTCIIHSGMLSEGHKLLKAQNRQVTILAAKEIKKDSLKEYEVICVDEAQRLYSNAMDIILEQAARSKKLCVFSYDFQQALSKAEMRRNNPKRLNETEGFQEFELTGRIRTNKEINSFIRIMLRLSDLPKKRLSYDNIDILYANSLKESDAILRLYISKGYKFITITPSQYVENEIDHYSATTNSHQVIGQEFDDVVVIIDSNFRYSESGILQGKEHPNPDYLFAKLFYQNITRARKRLCVIVLDNPNIFEKLIRVKNHTIT